MHDGPGCRTNVFFAGCPLQCKWCANPESWSLRKQLLFADKVCKWEKGCRACRNICPYGSVQLDKAGKPNLTWNVCHECETFECVPVCPNYALKQCVTEYTVDKLMAILRRDFSNWGADGGVTFSGGEPLLQHEFLAEVLKKCHTLQIHTAIETSGYAKQEVFCKILHSIDFAFIDVKHMDREKHKQGTGVDNDLILSNIVALKKSEWKGRTVLRQPTIAGYNDTDENAQQIIKFMHQNSLYEINLLKFHRLGLTKWDQLGKNYEYKNRGNVADTRMEHLQALYLEHDIACYIGDNTAF